MSVIYPSLPVVLFNLAAVIARGELPDPAAVEVRVGDHGEIRVELRLADSAHLRRWATRCGNDAERFIHETPWDDDGDARVITTTHGHFAGAYIHLTCTTAAANRAGDQPEPTGGTP